MELSPNSTAGSQHQRCPARMLGSRIKGRTDTKELILQWHRSRSEDGGYQSRQSPATSGLYWCRLFSELRSYRSAGSAALTPKLIWVLAEWWLLRTFQGLQSH